MMSVKCTFAVQFHEDFCDRRLAPGHVLFAAPLLINNYSFRKWHEWHAVCCTFAHKFCSTLWQTIINFSASQGVQMSCYIMCQKSSNCLKPALVRRTEPHWHHLIWETLYITQHLYYTMEILCICMSVQPSEEIHNSGHVSTLWTAKKHTKNVFVISSTKASRFW